MLYTLFMLMNVYRVIVWFATATSEKQVAQFETRDAAMRRAFEYLGADARGVWIQHPNGDYEDLTGRGFSPITVKNRL